MVSVKEAGAMPSTVMILSKSSHVGLLCNISTHCGLGTPYNDIDMGQH